MQRDYRTIFGIILIAAGALIGLQQWGYLRGDWNEALFAGLWALGAVYLFDMARAQKNDWLTLPALVLAALAASSLLGIFFPALGGAIGGGIFLGAIGAGFLMVYRREPANWWALIPSGTLFSLALISILNDLRADLPFETGGLLFLGLGLTFLIISQLRNTHERVDWAVFPGTVLMLFGAFVALRAEANWNYIWPVFIILGGVYLLWQSLRKR